MKARKISVILYTIVPVLMMLIPAVSSAEGFSVSGSASTEDGVEADAETEGDDAAEEYVDHQDINLHLALGYLYGGLAWADNYEDNMLTQGGLGMRLALDFVFYEPLAFQLQGGYNYYFFSEDDPDQPGNLEKLPDGYLGGGLRARLLVNHCPAVTMEGGDPWGNLWVDAHINYHRVNFDMTNQNVRGDWEKDRGGFDIGLGYEFSIAEDFMLGPFFRYSMIVLGSGPNWDNILAGVEFSFGMRTQPKDTDGDGITDDIDQCRDDAEDMDEFEDEDGCPDSDNDNDGIKDADDKCPNEAEDMDGFEVEDGCPDTDNDNDGILDADDKCPDEAEDKDGFEDEDGCPDNDNDADGVPDVDDKCPTEAEDMDEFEDEDGCPDTDNDGDKVLDADDKCPNEAETINGKEDEDGCPDLVRVEGDQIKILEKVYFAYNKSAILKKSYPVLEEVAAVIKAKPEIRVRVEGHTDNKGSSRYNKKLSEKRADSVMAFLAKQGIAEDRLEAVGHGPDRPIADNKTEGGRAENRRVEFHIIKPEPEAAPEAPESAEPAAEAETPASE